MNEFVATMGVVNMGHLEDNIAKRKHIVEVLIEN